MKTDILATKPKRKFLPEKINYDSFDELKTFFEELVNRTIGSKKALEKWMKDVSETEAVLSEERASRFISLTRETENEKNKESYNQFIRIIEPNLARYTHELNKKLLSNPHIHELDKEIYGVMIRELSNQEKIYREENIPLFTLLDELEQVHGKTTGAMTIMHDGKELTMQEAGRLLKHLDRNIREEIWMKLHERRKQDEKILTKNFSEMITLRDKTAKNAGFKNFRDFRFAQYNRFDYSPDDCKRFHEAVRKEVMPRLNELDKKRKEKLSVNKLKLWDLQVDLAGKEPLKPFNNTKELLEKTIKCYNHLDNYFGERLKILDAKGFLDLESRKGKRGGGYNYPLLETGIPFIFMNAVGTQRDVETLLHEGGHAIHAFLSQDLPLTNLKNAPKEIAELASMSMEYLSSDYWGEYYEKEEDKKRALREKLEGAINTLASVAMIDKFQHWIYENPNHTEKERNEKWFDILKTYHSNIIDFEGVEEHMKISWQKVLHIFEIPFYYIEYAICELGAIAMWRQYKQVGQRAIENYKNALSLGNTKTMPEVYETAGIKFDFSQEYLRELMNFVKEELGKLE